MSGCQCRQGKVPCPNPLSESKNVLCRPCAKDWHASGPCQHYEPEPIKHLVPTCSECGFDSAKHPIPRGAFA